MRYDCKENENTDKDKALGKELLETRSILVSEAISSELAGKVYAQLLILNQRSETEPIKVYVNSRGGDADSGFGIYDMLKFTKAPIITIACGICASAAVTVFLGADKGKNYSLSNSRFLLHQPSTGVQGSASDLQITAREIEIIRARYNDVVAEVTGKKSKKISEDADRDFWLSAQDAKSYGLVSKIITSDAELS